MYICIVFAYLLLQQKPYPTLLASHGLSYWKQVNGANKLYSKAPVSWASSEVPRFKKEKNYHLCNVNLTIQVQEPPETVLLFHV